MKKLEYREVMWAEMSPDIYDGPECDQVKPRWWGEAEGDKGGDYQDEPLQFSAAHFHPGTKVRVLEPECPKCQQIASSCRNYEHCDFDWDFWVECEYS